MSDAHEPTGVDSAQVAFHPPLVLLAAVVVASLLRDVWPLRFLPDAVPPFVGQAIASAAILLFAWAVITMVRGKTSVPTNTPTTAIVANGPYRFTRNPIYLAMVVLQLGAAVWKNSLWFVVFALVTAGLLTWGVIRREERYLERKFGDAYVAYRSSVRRWL